MPFNGQVYRADCSAGGLTGNKNIDAVDPTMMVWPSRNINMHRGGRETRGGTTHVYPAQISGTPEGRGIYDFRMIDGTQYIVTAWSDGTVYKDDTNTIKTGMATGSYFSFETAGNKLFIADGTSTVQVWTGSAIADISSPATDWATTPPFQLVRHGRGNSQRLWAANYKGVYYSKNYAVATDFEDFTSASVTGLLPIQTGDGWGIVGMIEHNKELWAFGKRTSYRIADSSTTLSEWGYITNPWVGGVAHWRLLVRTPNNDLIAMMEDGEIYSMNAVQEFGDYKAASLTRPSFMHEWIRANVDLSDIDKFHATFDPTLRAIKFFVVRSGQSEVDTALVYFIDRKPEEAWMVHDHLPSATGLDLSGYSAAASTLVRKSTGVYRVYTQGYVGWVWELESSSYNDNGTAYYSGWTTPALSFDNIRELKGYRNIQAVLESVGNYDLQVKYWIDGKYIGSGTINMGSSASVYDTAKYDVDTYGDLILIDTAMPIGDVGKRLQMEIYNSTINQRFFISTLLFDFQARGPRPV